MSNRILLIMNAPYEKEKAFHVYDPNIRRWVTLFQHEIIQKEDLDNLFGVKVGEIYTDANSMKFKDEHVNLVLIKVTVNHLIYNHTTAKILSYSSITWDPNDPIETMTERSSVCFDFDKEIRDVCLELKKLT